MVQHIVMWKLKDELTDIEKDTAKKNMKEKLEALVGKIPGLNKLTVSNNYKDGYFDLCLLAYYDDKQALEVYQNHEEHLKVKEYVHSVVMDRAFCDSEI